jgi:hypothetical protein
MQNPLQYYRMYILLKADSEDKPRSLHQNTSPAVLPEIPIRHPGK